MAAERARAAGCGDVSPLDLVAALLAAPRPAAGPATSGPPAAATRPGIGSALAGVISAAAGAAAKAGASEVSTDHLLAAALAAAADTGVRGAPAAHMPLTFSVDPRRDVVDHALRVLARRDAALVVLHGSTTAAPVRVLAALARRLASGDVPAALRGVQFVSLEGGPPLQSLGHRAAAQLRAIPSGGRAVAFVDDVLATAGAPGGIDALLGALAAGTGS